LCACGGVAHGRSGWPDERIVTMARFDRKAEASKDSTSLDAATRDLQSFVEHEVQEILDAAVSRAEQIEREATRRAKQTTQDAVRKSEALLKEAFTRAWRILDGIDLLENGVGDMIAALRAEMESFAADLGSSNGAGPARRPPAGTLSTPAYGEPTVDGNHLEVEEMIVEQVAALHRQGRPRAEAERLVMRFKQGQDYLHVIDRIY
jgi:hypothetical protein